jgi:hypothetical protein
MTTRRASGENLGDNDRTAAICETVPGRMTRRDDD